MIISLFAVGTISTSAWTTEEIIQILNQYNHIISGDYSYLILEDGTAGISCYFGNEENVVIPDTIDNIKVTSMGHFPYKNIFNNTYHETNKD